MNAEADLFDAFGVNIGYHGAGRYPLARLVSLCLARTMTIIDYVIGGYRDGESTLTFGILKSLRKGDLLVADRHFAAATSKMDNSLRISLAHAVRAIISFSAALSRVPLALVWEIYEAMLVEIASHVNPARPG